MKGMLLVAALVTAADQASKALARRMSGPITLIPGVLGLRYCENTGVAFSLLSGVPWLPALLSVAMIVLGALALRRYQLGRVSRLGAALVLGGAVGNLIDRALLGYVVDMVEVLAFHFAVFNVADIAICAGGALLAFSLMLCPREWREKQKKEA